MGMSPVELSQIPIRLPGVERLADDVFSYFAVLDARIEKLEKKLNNIEKTKKKEKGGDKKDG